MKLLKKLFTALLFVIYLFALSQAAFGKGDADSLIRRKARLVNVDVLESARHLHHKCAHGDEVELMIEVLVDSRGVVRAYDIPDCPDKVFQARLRDKVMHLLFVPAISVAGKAVPSTVSFTLFYKGKAPALARFTVD